jgi:hypothetical protein
VRSRTEKLLALVALVAASVGLVGVPSAAFAADDAATATTAPAGGQQGGATTTSSFALAPTGTDPAEPSSRPNLSYSLAPGAAIQDSVTLWNYGNIPLTFDVYASDAFNTSAGGFDVLPGDKKSQDAGAWVTLAQQHVTVAPGTSLEIPIAVTVPAGARPGDHAAGIIASSKTPGTDAEGHHVVFDRRTGSRLYLRVTGSVNPALVVEDLSTAYHPAVNSLDGSMDVTYTVRNTGNVRLGAHQRVAVNDLFGTVDERTGRDIPELLPGSALTYHERFTGVAATLRVSADVTLTPFAPRTSGDGLPKGSESFTSTSHTWAIPWTLLVILVLIALVVLLVRRRRRKLESGAGPGPGSGRGGGRSGAPASGNGAQPAPRVGVPATTGTSHRTPSTFSP